MKAISKRICNLESQFGLGPETEQLLLVVTAAGRGLALDEDTCVRILRESGFLPTGPVGVVNLAEIPKGLNAEQLEKFLRKDGAETRGFHNPQTHDEPEGASLGG